MTNILPLFSPDFSLSENDIDLLKQAGTKRSYASGKVVFHIGDRTQEMFYIISGEIELRFEGEKGHKRIGAGQHFGELAVFINEPRSASAVTTMDTEMIILDLDAVHVLLDSIPHSIFTLLRNSCAYLLHSERDLIDSLESKNHELEEALSSLKETQKDLQRSLTQVKQLKNKLQSENRYLQEEIRNERRYEDIVHRSKTFNQVIQEVEQVAPTDATVLILGETGTGKEVVARAIHRQSNRSNRPLVKVNCGTLPANLIESELFGHEKGAFTGATERRTGRFELADEGTIFLDEVGDLPSDLQVKLLRVLQEGEFERLGSSQTRSIDVRVIAATNRDLETAVKAGEFREDLYYRLHVFPIHVPPLRDRKDDIPLLAEHFLNMYTPRMGKTIGHIPAEVITALQRHSWPGNVRELENTIERAVIITRGNDLQLGNWFSGAQEQASVDIPILTLEAAERIHIEQALDAADGRVSGENGAASLLDINPKTLESRMKKLGISRRK